METVTKFRDSMDQQIFDVFEPALIQAALDHLNKPTNLGHLIFGKDIWRDLGGEVPEIDDPLTKMFHQRGDYSLYLQVHYSQPFFSLCRSVGHSNIFIRV